MCLHPHLFQREKAMTKTSIISPATFAELTPSRATLSVANVLNPLRQAVERSSYAQDASLKVDTVAARF